MTIRDSDTVSDAKDYIEKHLKEGARCPCCRQLCKLYKRRIHSTMAKWLIWLVYEFEQRRDWIDVRETPVRGGDYAKLAYWRLIRNQIDYNRRKKLAPGRTGLWAPTSNGIAFAHGLIEVPKYAHVFNQEPCKYSKAEVSIVDCLGTDFDFQALWEGNW